MSTIIRNLPIIHRRRSKEIFGGAKDFRPNFSKLARKFFLRLLPTNLHPKIMKIIFWCGLQKKVFICFSANVGRHFLKSNNVGRHFCPDFRGYCQDI